MGLFGGPNPEKIAAQGDAQAAQRFLHETFGLTRVPGAGYALQGAVDMTQEVRDVATAMELVKGMPEQKRFKFVCILPAQYTTGIIFGSKPPLAGTTALYAADAAELISALQKDSGGKIVELDGAWILTLS